MPAAFRDRVQVQFQPLLGAAKVTNSGYTSKVLTQGYRGS